jgi:hypothetical protein
MLYSLHISHFEGVIAFPQENEKVLLPLFSFQISLVLIQFSIFSIESNQPVLNFFFLFFFGICCIS